MWSVSETMMYMCLDEVCVLVEVGIIVSSRLTYQCGGDFFVINPTRAKLKTYFSPLRTHVDPVHPNTPLPGVRHLSAYHT